MTSTAPSTKRLERSTPSETAIRWPTTELLLSCEWFWADHDAEGELARGRRSSRRELVFGRTQWVRTMMQSCASTAKLRAAGPLCNPAANPLLRSDDRRAVSGSAGRRSDRPFVGSGRLTE